MRTGKTCASGIWSIDLTVPAWTEEDQQAARKLVEDIASLPPAEELTLAHESLVDQLLLRYAALDPVQQAWVTNYALLEAAKARIMELLEQSGAAPESSWPMLRGGSDNLAVTHAPTPESAEGTKLKWESWFGGELDAWGSGYSGQPILVGDDILIPRNHQLQKLDKATGEIIKAEATAAPLGYNSYAAYGGGRIYVPLTDGKLQAFDAVSLRPLWLNDQAGSGMNGLSAVLYYDEVVYTGFTDFTSGCFAAYNAADGSLLWRYDGPSYYWAGAAAAGEFILFCGDDGKLVSADAKTGRVADTLEMGASVRSSVVWDGQSAYLTTSAGQVVRVPVAADGTFGAPVTANLEYSFTASPVVWNGELFAVAYDPDYSVNGGKLYVLDADTLSVKASAPLPGDSQSSPLLAVGRDGKLRIYAALNDSTGSLVCGTWDGSSLQVETIFVPAHANYSNRSPIADEDGTVYYSNDAGYLYAAAPGEGGSEPGGDGDGDVEDDGDKESHSSMSGYWTKDRLTTSQIQDRIDEALWKGSKNVAIDMKDTLMVKGQVFAGLKDMPGLATLTLDCGTHTWTVNASQSFDPDIDLRLSLVQQNYRDDLEQLLGAGSDYLALHFDHSGPLPGTMNVVLRLPSALHDRGLYLYRVVDGSYVALENSLLASGEYGMLTLTQGGDYLITTQPVSGAAAQSGEMTPNPLTGGIPSWIPAVAARLALAAAWASQAG